MIEIEIFPNPAPNRKYVIEHVNNEFTSLCPKTGLPDFGKITIRYVPDKVCMELKALKYYFLSFRNKGIFYEELTNQFLDDLVKSCDPHEMEIITEWGVRGGMNSTIIAKHVKSNV